ncbi:MAG: serine/threonine-protein phosphatase [Oscillospiraceae bacterium]|nr:serine/threonine-protein phosphatase [Oscillospiraceae bacterium]
MNNLCAEIGWKSLNHVGEELCGDHIEVIETDDDSMVLVLADGLGSGVKASILSTLTSKIIATMTSQGIPLEECVKTIAATLPICKVREVAYSTFTIIRLINNEEAEIICYDNPDVIMFRDGKIYDYPYKELDIEGKHIHKARIKLRENDTFIAMSDGCIHAGVGMSLNFGWERKDIAEYMEALVDVGFTAKTLSTVLTDECLKLYGGNPGDDTTAMTVRIRARQQTNLMIGPPSDRNDCDKMVSLFLSKGGKRIVCGGTTSTIVSKHLRKPIIPDINYFDPEIPPTATIEGIDLVTEGVITMSRVNEYAKDYIADNDSYKQWNYKRDGAALIARMLFEEATDINFYVGRAMNPAHQNPNLPINFNIKMQLVNELSESLKKMGKKIKVNYF